jgi:N-alpha-acetyltransferase 50
MPVAEHLDVQITDINNNNIEQLKLINVTTLPVRYTDKFYKDLLEKGSREYLKFATWNGFQVGATCARIEAHDTVPDSNRLYIMTINVLAAYRRRGIGGRDFFLILNYQMDD